MLRSRGQAIGGMELAREFSAWQERSGHVVTRGHERWWERDRILHLQLFAAAGVKIRAGQTRLITSLKIFWKDFAGDLLDLLSAWLRSGAADALSREALALSAVRHIRSERTKEAGSWWPHHGDALDVLCLTEGVVTEARLFEEWQASKAPDADQLTLFQKERATPKRLPIDTRRALARQVADGNSRKALTAAVEPDSEPDSESVDADSGAERGGDTQDEMDAEIGAGESTAGDEMCAASVAAATAAAAAATASAAAPAARRRNGRCAAGAGCESVRLCTRLNWSASE